MSNMLSMEEYFKLRMMCNGPQTDKTRQIMSSNKIPNQFFDIDFPSLVIYPMHDVITAPKWRMKIRNNFKKFMKEMDWSFRDLCDCLDRFDMHSPEYEIPIRIAAIEEQLPEKVKQIQNIRTEMRKDVSRVLMRKKIPSDLVPMVCAFTVQGSKQYDYMK